MSKKLTTEEFIEKAKQIHGDKYKYDKVHYIDSKSKVCIICPTHGEFYINSHSFLCGHGCPKCKGRYLTTEEFVIEAKKVHGDKYDYTHTKYYGMKKKIKIFCKKHGFFYQLPYDHLKGIGCKKCANKCSYSTEEWVEKAKQIHGDKYDYSKVEYVNAHTKVCIICTTHGEFWQKPISHLNGQGCPKCSHRSYKKTTEEFIAESNIIHNHKYNYSKVAYINAHTKVCIICPIHGEFWQKPNSHLNGQGCPICNESNLEKEIKILLQTTIEFVEQKHFKWLGKQSLDFYIPAKNIAIECQGIQHFQPIEYFGGEEEFKYRTKLDENKLKLCKEHGIKLLYYSNLGITYPYKVIEDKNELIQKILE